MLLLLLLLLLVLTRAPWQKTLTCINVHLWQAVLILVCLVAPQELAVPMTILRTAQLFVSNWSVGGLERLTHINSTENFGETAF